MTSVPTARASAPDRRAAWAEGLDDLRAAATTEPGRLRVIGALLALLVVAFGAIAAVQVSGRADAVEQGVRGSQTLSKQAAEISRLLAGLDTHAAENFLSRGTEGAATRAEYEKDHRELLQRLSDIGPRSKDARAQISVISSQLPRYTALVERAWSANRQGQPLGGAYLTNANETMRDQLRPAARRLNDKVTRQLADAYDSAIGWPWFALVAGLLAVGALTWAQHRLYLRTHRVFNTGLLGATAATVALFLWLVVGCAGARSGLLDSRATGVDSLQAVGEARIDALQARGAETLRLVARGSVQSEKKTKADKGDFYEATYLAQMVHLYGPSGAAAPTADSKLGEALALADDAAGEGPVNQAAARVRTWRARHAEAVGKTVGQDETDGSYSDEVGAALEKAQRAEQDDFDQAVRGAPSDLPLLAAGAAVLALLGAASAVWGVGRRVSEYR